MKCFIEKIACLSKEIRAINYLLAAFFAIALFNFEVFVSIIEDDNELLLLLIPSLSLGAVFNFGTKRNGNQITLPQNLYKEIFGKMVEPAILSDKNGIIIFANDASKKMLGCEQDELLGNSLQNFILNPIEIKTELQDEEIKHSLISCLLFRKDNTHVFAEVTKQKISDNYFLELVHDISFQRKEHERCLDLVEKLCYERDMLEEQSAELVVLNSKLEISENSLKDLNAEKDKFFSIIAHDLKSPFAGIMGYTSLLLEEYDEMSLDEIKDFISSLDKLSKNTFKLIENLLDWSRLQTGKMKCEPINIHLSQTIFYIISLLSGNAQQKNISLINKVPDDQIALADERMLHSILENLISNSIKFTNRGGSITIRHSLVNIFHEVTIEDTGIGMSPEVLEKIFRIDSNYTTYGTENEKGTGLGVLLCKEMIEKQGGAIKVESIVGVGTKFKFILPAVFEHETVNIE